MSGTPALEVRGLRFRYRGRKELALDGIDLEVDEGEFVVVVGPSGAGKSTLCFTLNGLIPHFVRGRMAGTVMIHGRDAGEQRVAELARSVGLVFQDFEAQLFSTNVELEVAFGMENFAVPVEEMRARVAAAIELVGLSGTEGREPATLSGGQKQRLAIATVLALRPSVLVMDEPTTDLDPVGKAEVFAVARRLREEGTTLVVVEHETEEVADADLVVVLGEGRIVDVGLPDDVFTRPAWLEERGVQPLGVAQLLDAVGEPPMLDVDDATRHLRDRGFRVADGAWSGLREEEDAREVGYGDPVLEARGVEHRYPNGVQALTGVDLTLHRGEFVGVIGSNGSGKTTLVKHFNGLLEPTAGDVIVAGASTRGQSVKDLGLKVGYVFQNPDHQIFAETVREEVAFGPRNHEVGESEVEERVADAIAAVGLEGRDEDDPFIMTKGERQRVAVASVLATRPTVIILDEPTTGLDYREQRRMMELVRALNEAGHTIICVTHAMWVVAEYCHRVVAMAAGKVRADGWPRDVFADEVVLRDADLKPPQLVHITTALGRTLLSAGEARRALRREA